ncbi:MAG: MFS transporter [Methylococcaceae bacterium]|nr:MFS transporter [Methylococcaceae bacterium]
MPASHSWPSPTIAARVERLPVSGFHRRFIALISLGGWFDFYDIFMMAYLGAALQQSGFMSRDEFGLTLAAGFVGMFIGTVLFGMGSDRFGRRTAFLFMLLIYSTFTLLGAFAPDPQWLMAARLLAGVGIGAELVVIDTYVTEMMPSRVRGRYVAITQVVGFSAIPVVAFLSRWLVPTHWMLDGWRWVMIIGAAGALWVWYLRRALPESPRWLESRGRCEEAETLMAGIEREVAAETGPLPIPAASASPVTTPPRVAELLQPAYRRRTLLMLGFHLLQTIGIYGFANWAPTFLLAQGKSLGQSLDYGFWIAVVSPVGPVLGMLTTERLQRRTALVILPLLMAATGFVFPYVTSALAIICVGAAITLFSYWFSAVLHAYQAELFPTRLRATGVGFTYSLSRLSAAFSSLIIGALLPYGVMAVFIFTGAAMILCALLVAVLGPKTNARVLEDLSG